MLSYVNNKFCSLNKAQISVNDRGYQFGDAVYEVIYYKNQETFISKKCGICFYKFLFFRIALNFVK